MLLDFQLGQAPVDATVRTPNSLLAVPNHDDTDTMNPKIGEKAAAFQFMFFHVSVKVIGTTADETRIPITR